MAKPIRLLVAASVMAAGSSFLTATPAHACINPDEPTCPIGRAVCDATDPVAKYRDKLPLCNP